MNLSFSLCPESIAALPAKGRSAFVRAAILAFNKPASPSKGLQVAVAPAPVAIVEPVAVAPAPIVVETAEPVAWVRTWRKPSCAMPADVDYSKLVHKLEGGRSTCLNPPPWTAVPGLTMNHCLDWQDYVKMWRFPDPFPGPLEWHAMGEPSEPLPEHSRFQEPVEPLPVEPLPVEPLPVAVLPVEPLPVEPLPVEPLPVEPLPVEPLPVAGMSSSNILEEV